MDFKSSHLKWRAVLRKQPGKTELQLQNKIFFSQENLLLLEEEDFPAEEDLLLLEEDDLRLLKKHDLLRPRKSIERPRKSFKVFGIHQMCLWKRPENCLWKSTFSYIYYGGETNQKSLPLTRNTNMYGSTHDAS